MTGARKTPEEAAAGSSGGEKPAGDGKVDDAPEIKFVEMPEEKLKWILTMKWEDYPIPSLKGNSLFTPEELADEEEAIDATKAGRDAFFSFQAYCRERFEEYGYVLVPEDYAGPNPAGIQDLVHEEWEKAKLLFDSDDDDEDHHSDAIEAAPPSNPET
ncbi:hypothetical protein ACP70R_007430 [Stipagrostis hirtigluma subsp. patula]